jgi:hypothetical protein
MVVSSHLGWIVCTEPPSCIGIVQSWSIVPIDQLGCEINPVTLLEEVSVAKMADEEETPAEAAAVEEVQMSVLDALKEVSLNFFEEPSRVGGQQFKLF